METIGGRPAKRVSDRVKIFLCVIELFFMNSVRTEFGLAQLSCRRARCRRSAMTDISRKCERRLPAVLDARDSAS